MALTTFEKNRHPHPKSCNLKKKSVSLYYVYYTKIAMTKDHALVTVRIQACNSFIPDKKLLKTGHTRMGSYNAL